MILVNFAHPLTPVQLATIAGLAGQEIARVIEVRTRFDAAQAFGEQARALIDAAGLTPREWQTALLLVELHGRCGYFPAVVRLRPLSGTTPPRFEVAEILNLQAVRDAARAQR